MKSILRATALLSSSSLISIGIGVITVKLWAVLLGPGGLGWMGLLQSLAGLGGLLAGAGVSVGLVRSGAAAVAREDVRTMAATQRAAMLLMWLCGVCFLAAVILFREPVAGVMLGRRDQSGAAIIVAIGVLFGLVGGAATSTLNAHHRVAVLAGLGIVNSVLGAVIGVAFVLAWGRAGIAPSIALTATGTWVVALWAVRRHVSAGGDAPSFAEIRGAAGQLLRFGMPYTASMLMGAGVQFILPVLVLHALGTTSVGLYRAATLISVNYLGFLLIAMQQDYYPRVSAVTNHRDTLVSLVNQQARLVLLLGGPVILATLALSPLIVTVVYSASFARTTTILQWQLLGDIFRFASWTLSFVILARCRSSVFFCTELAGGAMMLGSMWLGVTRFGLEGIGIGFLVASIGYYLVVAGVVFRDIRLSWTASNFMLLGFVCAAAVAVRAISSIGLASLGMPIALCVAAGACAVSVRLLWHDVGGLRRARAH